jgi:hypothetical protein
MKRIMTLAAIAILGGCTATYHAADPTQPPSTSAFSDAIACRASHPGDMLVDGVLGLPGVAVTHDDQTTGEIACMAQKGWVRDE